MVGARVRRARVCGIGWEVMPASHGIRVGAHNTLITPLERDTRRGDVCSPRSTSNVGRWCG